MQQHLTAHTLKADTDDLRCTCLSLFAVDHGSFDFSQTISHVILQPDQLLYLFRMVRVHLLYGSSEPCHTRNILGTGTHAGLLAASIDQRFNLHATPNV